MRNPSVDELLSHSGFVRRIAAGLLRDANDVDDVVQETYVAALKAPPPAGLRAWLAAVARNAARMRLRGARRRVAHEAAAARPGACEGAADAAARMEVHRRLVEAVLALDEPVRTMIVLRYLDDLPPRAIAARLDLPLDTVRSRLRRGLAQLRGRLDAWSGGDRAAWSLALLFPLRDAECVAHLAGAAIVGKKTAAVLIVWSALATGLYVHEVSQPRASPPRAAESGRDAGPREIPEARPIEAPALTATQELQAFHRRWQGSRTGPLTGTLLEAGGRTPVAAVVSVQLKGSLPDGTPLAYETTTAPDGSFVFPAVRYPLDYNVTCAAEREGIDDSRGSVHVAEAGDAVQIHVRRQPLLQGEVTDLSGRPLAGADVYRGVGPGRASQVRTDASGKFRITLSAEPSAEAPLRIAAAAPGYRPGRAKVDQVAPYLWLANVALEPGGAIRARLLKSDGTPAAGVSARVIFERRFPKGAYPEEPDDEMRALTWTGSATDRRGEPTLESTLLQVRAEADGGVASWFPLTPSRAWLVVDLEGIRTCVEVPGIASSAQGSFDLGAVTLSAAPPPRVRFVDGAGKPLGGIEVHVREPDAPTPFLQDCGSAKTDAGGFARLPHVTAGRKYWAFASLSPGQGGQADPFVAEEGATVVLKVN